VFTLADQSPLQRLAALSAVSFDERGRFKMAVVERKWGHPVAATPEALQRKPGEIQALMTMTATRMCRNPGLKSQARSSHFEFVANSLCISG
jgi:hypothetical protein